MLPEDIIIYADDGSISDVRYLNSCVDKSIVTSRHTPPPD